jgi:Tol biopolymer transport system component
LTAERRAPRHLLAPPSGPLVLSILLASSVAVPSTHAAYQGANGDLMFNVPGGRSYLVQPDGQRRRVLQTRTDLRAPSWSGDGRTVIAAGPIGPSSEGRRRHLIILTARRAVATTELAGDRDFPGVRSPALSPTGRHVAFVRIGRGLSPATQIAVARRDGTRERRVVQLALKNMSRPRWSPSGTHLLFTSAEGVWVIARDGTGLRRLYSTITELASGADWSPDGREVVFASFGRPEGPTIMRVPTHAAEPTSIADVADLAPGGDVVWSPDGRSIAFVTAQRPAVWVMDADGSGRRRVARAPGHPAPRIASIDWQARQ